MRRVLDLAFVDGVPVAVLAWVTQDGKLTASKYIPLDQKLLRKAAPIGSFWYDGIAIDPY